VARSSLWRTRRAPHGKRPTADRSNINTIPSQRLDANLMNGVWLHPTTVTAITELEQWYDLEFRFPLPPINERWPR